MSNTERIGDSKELQNQIVTIQSGDKLWNILQSLNINPTSQMQITWRRRGNESKVPLISDKWRNLPIGAKLTIEGNEIIVENPNYKPKLIENKVYKPIKPNISEEKIKRAKAEEKEAEDILINDLKTMEQEQQDIHLRKELLISEVNNENDKFRSSGVSKKIMKEITKTNQELVAEYGDKMAETLLLKRKFMGYPDFKEKIDNFHETQGYNLYSDLDKTVRIERLNSTYDFLKSLEKELDNYEKSAAQKEAETVFYNITEKWYDNVFLPMEIKNADIWNEFIKRGDIKHLRKDFYSKLVNRFKADSIKMDALKATMKKLEQNKNSYLKDDFLYNYAIGKYAKKKSQLMYKMYLLGVFDGGS